MYIVVCLAVFTMLCVLTAYRAFKLSLFSALSLYFVYFVLMFFARPLLVGMDLDPLYPTYMFSDNLDLVMFGQFVGLAWFILVVGIYRITLHLRVPTNLVLPDLAVLSQGALPLVCCAAFTAVAVAVGTALIAQYGSVDAVVRSAKFDKALAGTFALRQFAALGMFFSVVLCATGCVWLRGARSTWRVLTGIATFGANGFCFLLWGGREAMAVMALFLIAVLTRRRDLSYRLLPIIVGGLAGVMAMDWLYATRWAIIAGDDRESYYSVFRLFSISFHLIRFDALLLVLRDWDMIAGLRGGVDFVDGLLQVIPRFAWPNKPDQMVIGAWFRQLYEPYSVNGWPVSTPGEWLINFGYPGLLFGAASVGAVFALIERQYGAARQPGNLGVVIVFSLLVFQEGTILQAPFEYVMWIIPLTMIARGYSAVTGMLPRKEPAPPSETRHDQHVNSMDPLPGVNWPALRSDLPRHHSA